MSKLQKFTEEALSQAGVRKALVKVGAPWCGPCQSVALTLEALSDEGYVIFDVNTDEDNDFTIKYNIRSVPTFILLEDGEEVKRITGVQSKEALVEFFGE